MKCIVSVATTLKGGNKFYIEAQKRQLASVEKHDLDVLAWTDEYPPDSPTHGQIPYAFKPYAFIEALRRGYRYVLWCDSTVWVRRDTKPVFDLIETQGYVLWRNGWNCGQWCTDAALAKQGLNRNEALTIPDFTGCCMGLDLQHDKAAKFLRLWTDAAMDGVSFPGPWTNASNLCSKDDRCLGHRHDQVIGSIIADRLGMTLTDPGRLFSYWNDGKIADSVVMVNGR
jgi:hypothetical protein